MKTIVTGCWCGYLGEVEALARLCYENSLWLPEDAGEGHGAPMNGKPIVSLGHAPFVSCCDNKVDIIWSRYGDQ